MDRAFRTIGASLLLLAGCTFGGCSSVVPRVAPPDQVLLQRALDEIRDFNTAEFQAYTAEYQPSDDVPKSFHGKARLAFMHEKFADRLAAHVSAHPSASIFLTSSLADIVALSRLVSEKWRRCIELRIDEVGSPELREIALLSRCLDVRIWILPGGKEVIRAARGEEWDWPSE